MASDPITSWQIHGERVADFILGGSKVTADGDCSHEIKSHLLLGRKVMTNLDSILKSRDSARFGSTYTKIGTIQRLPWPLRKDDTQIREAFHIFTHEKMLNITHYQRNANQNLNEVPLHASQNGCYPKVYKQ